MKRFIEIIKRNGIVPKVIFDIGAYNAADLALLCEWLNINCGNGYAFEPHPGMQPHCHRRNVNVIECAISNYDGTAEFNAIDLYAKTNHGCSSLYATKRPHNTITVDVHRIDTLIDSRIVPVPDVVKIDVEGKSYEALEGFGRYLRLVRAFHIETELKELFQGQKLKADVVQFMEKNGFDAAECINVGCQEDVIFLRKD